MCLYDCVWSIFNADNSKNIDKLKCGTLDCWINSSEFRLYQYTLSIQEIRTKLFGYRQFRWLFLPSDVWTSWTSERRKMSFWIKLIEKGSCEWLHESMSERFHCWRQNLNRLVSSHKCYHATDAFYFKWIIRKHSKDRFDEFNGNHSSLVRSFMDVFLGEMK